MTIQRTIIDHVPKTIEGLKYADDYEDRMTYYAANVTRTESATQIILTTVYSIDDADTDPAGIA